MGTVGGDDMLISNNRRRARGGSRFFGDFLFLGDLDQPNNETYLELHASSDHASLLKFS